MVLVHIVLES